MSDDDPRCSRAGGDSGLCGGARRAEPIARAHGQVRHHRVDWMTQLDLDASAIQCWSSLQQNYGVNCCTIMSMMSEKLMPSACEVDVAGTVAMYALQLASGKPSALVDWNNNYGDDPNKCVFFHCGNWAKAFLPDIEIGTAPILGSILGEQNTYGALAGRTPSGPVTFARISTDDRNGRDCGLRRRGPVHRRRAEHVRHARRCRGAGAAEADARHLSPRLRASRSDERITHGRRARGSLRAVSGLGRVSPCGQLEVRGQRSEGSMTYLDEARCWSIGPSRR